MPVHFKVASHDSEPFEFIRFNDTRLTKPEELLTRARTTKCAELLQSSFSNKEIDFSSVDSSRGGFVHTVTTAYNRHHHLIFKSVKPLACFIDLSLFLSDVINRPDDVWIAILGQFNL